MNSVNLSTLLLLAGLVMLLINVILSAARLGRGQLRAGLLNVGLALAACMVITMGIVQLTFVESVSPVADVASDAAAANGGVQPISAKASDSSQPGSIPSAAEVTAMAQGSLPDPMKTAAANGKAPAAMMTAAAQPAAASRSSSTASGSLNVSISRLAPLATAAGAVVVLLAGLFLFQRERRRPDFNPSYSHGLLSVGTGIFAVVAVLVIPLMVSPVSAQAGGGIFPVAAQAQTTVTLPSRAARSATPSATPVPSLTPTEPPTLTPAVSETPIVLYTPISYTSTYSASTTTNCTVMATTGLNLRGDPSTDQMAIGRIFAGSLLPVTGQSVDKKWWRVVNDALGSRVEGWVNATYVKADDSCFDGSVPIVGAAGAATGSATSVTGTAPATLAATAAATSVATETASATPAATSTATPTIVETVADCTIMTISAASLRTGPGTAFTILGQIPDRTALTATQKTVDGHWLYVRYAAPDGPRDGWISSSLVMAATVCQHLASVTLTPTAAS